MVGPQVVHVITSQIGWCNTLPHTQGTTAPSTPSSSHRVPQHPAYPPPHTGHHSTQHTLPLTQGTSAPSTPSPSHRAPQHPAHPPPHTGHLSSQHTLLLTQGTTAPSTPSPSHRAPQHPALCEGEGVLGAEVPCVRGRVCCCAKGMIKQALSWLLVDPPNNFPYSYMYTYRSSSRSSSRTYHRDLGPNSDNLVATLLDKGYFMGEVLGTFP